jgi:putative serine protease PepD
MVKRSAIALVALALLLAGCGGSKTSQTASTTPAPARASASGSAGAQGEALQAAYRSVVDQVSRSVVQIETSEGLGSGIVFDDHGDIVTNAHVVGDAKSFTVTLSTGRQAKASLVGRWVPGDLAVIHTDAGDLHPATFADSSKLHVGDIVLALGNPLGLRSSVTQGIVSSLGRTVSEGNGVTIPAAIQTSAAINPGNSGGALADLEGRVIGVPTLAALDPQLGGSQAPGIGFAIPSRTVTSIARQLVDKGRVTESGRASLGVRVAEIVSGGVVIVDVTPGGAADKAGLKRGDVVLSLNGTPTPTLDALITTLSSLKPGQTVKITVRNPQGQEHTTDVTLGQLAQ